MMDAPDLDDQFLAVMGGVSAPVVVVTTMNGDKPHGTTVSAFASLSRRPPMIMLALDRGSDLLGHITVYGRFGINVLCDRQADVALAFAKKGADKFEGVGWSEEAGLPRLDGVTGWLACDTAQIVEGGDHLVLLGHVRRASDTPERPLVYHRREFGTHTALPADSSPLATTYGDALSYGEDPESPLALMGLV